MNHMQSGVRYIDRIRAGFTIVELLVVTGILSLLLALTLPAIQSSREAARRVQCQNHLRQIAIACSNFESAHRRWPGGCGSPRGADSLEPPGPFSAHTELLPFLDQANLFLQIDWTDNGMSGYPLPQGGVNALLQRQQVSVFICPSDAAARGRNNYRFCVGAGHIRNLEGAMSCLCMDGVHSPAPARIADGLSNTALCSERLRADQDDSQLHLATDVLTAGHLLFLQYAFYTQDPDRIRDACDRVNASGIERHYSNSGATWLYAGHAYTWYNHILEPNSAIPDCTQSGSSLVNAAVSARSQHIGGVNLALADGSVRFVSDTIALEIWRALARISDGVPHGF